MRLLAILALTTCGFKASLLAHVSEELRHAVESKQYHQVQAALQKKSIHPDSHELITLAKKYEYTPLLHAVQAYDNSNSTIRKFVDKRDFLETALFIEAKLPERVAQRQNYINHVKSSIPLSIEHDPHLKTTFILLKKSEKGVKIGEGMFKKVVRAIQYKKRPELVARATQSRNMDRELDITKKVHGGKGVFETRGFASHTAYGHKSISIYSKMYNAGSLQDVFDNGVKFSKWEKMKIALSLISGLNTLQSKGIVHRDLGCRNYLVNIPAGKPGHRNVEVVIADLGCGDYAKNSVHYKVQGNTSYTSPEGLFIGRMKRDDYYKSDVFALGTVLFQLLYGEPPDWQRHCWVKGRADPVGIRYHEMVNCIKSQVTHRRQKVQSRKATPIRKTKLLMFDMVNPDPHQRPSARELKARMERIFSEGN